jgi:hypothetical protein
MENMSAFFTNLLGAVADFLAAEPMIYFVTIGLVTFALSAFNVIKRR